LNFLQRVFVNVSFKGLSEVGRRLIGFGFVVFLGNTLGDEGVGEYGFMLRYTNLFAMIVDAGLNTLYAREAAKDPKSRQKIMSALLLIKLILSAVMAVLITSATYILISFGTIGVSAGETGTLMLFALYWVINTTIDLVNAVYIERQKLAYDSAINIGHRGLAVLLGIVLVLVFRNVFVVSVSYVIAAIVSLIVTCFVVYSKFDIMPWPKIGTKRVRHLLLEAIPLIFSIFFSFVYFYMDVVMLRVFTSTAVVGWYVVAFRVLEFTMLLPGAAALVVLPLFAKQFVQDRKQLVIISGNIIRLLFAAGFAVCIVLGTLAGRIVAIFGKDFGPDSQLALQILVWTVPLIYVDYVLIYLLVASGRQRKNAIAALICAALNITLNYFLIPIYSYSGAAFATVITQVLLMTLSARFVKEPLPTFRMYRYISRVAPAGLMAGVTLWFVRGALPELACLATLAVFVGSLLLFRAVTKADKELLSRLLSRREAN